MPLRVLERRSDGSDVEAVIELAREEGVTAFVVGDPVSLDGSVGPQARRVRAFAERLAAASGLPAELWDERLTSAQAKRARPHSTRRSARGNQRFRARTDDVAAAIILQGYLDRHSSEASSGSEP